MFAENELNFQLVIPFEICIRSNGLAGGSQFPVALHWNPAQSFSHPLQQWLSQPAAPRGLGFTAAVAAVFSCLQGSPTSFWKGFICAQGWPCSAGPGGDAAHSETMSWKKPNHWLLACSRNKEKGEKEIRSNSDLCFFFFFSKCAKMLWVYSSLTWQCVLVQLLVLRFVIWRSKSPGKAASTRTELPQSHRWQITQICRNSKQMG